MQQKIVCALRKSPVKMIAKLAIFASVLFYSTQAAAAFHGILINREFSGTQIYDPITPPHALLLQELRRSDVSVPFVSSADQRES